MLDYSGPHTIVSTIVHTIGLYANALVPARDHQLSFPTHSIAFSLDLSPGRRYECRINEANRVI